MRVVEYPRVRVVTCPDLHDALGQRLSSGQEMDRHAEAVEVGQGVF